jgi:hypothetical protein
MQDPSDNMYKYSNYYYYFNISYQNTHYMLGFANREPICGQW